MFNIVFFPENRSVFLDNVEKYCTAGQTTNECTIWSIFFACRITKATNTHSEYVTLINVPLQQWLHEAPHCYVIRTLHVLFKICPSSNFR